MIQTVGKMSQAGLFYLEPAQGCTVLYYMPLISEADVLSPPIPLLHEVV